MKASSPVLPSRPETTPLEVVLAEHQEEYESLPCLVIKPTEANELPAMVFISRFQLTDKEVESVIRNRSIWLSQLVFGDKYTPIKLEVEEPGIP